MADKDQRTEEATPRKKEKLREEGQIVRSQDVGSAAVVVATFSTLAVMGPMLVHALTMFTTRSLRLMDVSRPEQAGYAFVTALMPSAAPLMAASVAAAIAGAAQARVFSFSMLAFKPERLDPMKNIGGMIPGKEQMLEMLKQLLKLGAIGYLVYQVIAGAMPMFAALGSTSPGVAASSVAGIAQKLALRVGIAFSVVAAFDYWMAHRKFTTDAMMSKEEVREERKSEDGRPEVKEKIRRKMREMAKNRAVGDVRKATVLVVNPTHFAVALRYVPNKDVAPIILAKGKDELALEMRAQARKHQIPMLENKPLARALYATGKPGRAIPVDLYRAVAEVIAFVMQLRARQGGVDLVRADEQLSGDA